MIRKKKGVNRIYVDLDGEEGNAFYILGLAKKIGVKLGYDKEKIKRILRDMRSGDYVNLLKIFEKEFGKLVVLESGNEELLRQLRRREGIRRHIISCEIKEVVGVEDEFESGIRYEMAEDSIFEIEKKDVVKVINKNGEITEISKERIRDVRVEE